MSKQHLKDKKEIAEVDLEKVAIRIKNDFILSIQEVCAVVNLSKRSVENYTKKGDLKKVKIGSRVGYRGRSVQDWIEGLSS